MKSINKIFENNQLIMKLYSLYISDYNRSIDEVKVKSLAKDLQITDDYSFYLLFINFLGLDIVDNKEHLNLANQYIRPYLKKLYVEEYKNNPYYKNIVPKCKKTGKWTLKYQTYKPYELFVCNDLTIDNYYEYPNIGYFSEEFKYLTVLENNHEWMLITPNEIETMKKPIDKAFGNVITFGLGLGYFAYMVSLKDSVKSITVVEKDKDVIELFTSKILPFFEHKSKIKIINADAFEIMKQGINDYDYCFIDIWHDASDGVPFYVKFKQLEKFNNNVIIDYWVETTLVSYIKWYLYSNFNELKKLNKLSKDVEINDILNNEYINKILVEKN